MSDLVKKVKLGNEVLNIFSDFNPEDPREWDNLGTMVCFHGRYNLGDKHNYSDHEAFLLDLLEQTTGDTDKAERLVDIISERIDRDVYRSYGAYKKAVDDEILDVISKKFIVLPLYLYDHSGITISTSPFSCPWDSGQVGWIYVSKDNIRKEYGVKRVSQKLIDKVTKVVVSEVETYDLYIRGDVYGFKLMEVDSRELEAYLAEEELDRTDLDEDDLERFLTEKDSCWGFYGCDFIQNGILDHVGEGWAELLK